MTTLIGKRNSKFSSAICELLVACSVQEPPLDPIELLLAATDENLPVQPTNEPGKGLGEIKGDFEFYRRNPDMRPSVERIIEEIKEGEDYRDQIVMGGHRIFDKRDAVLGKSYLYLVVSGDH